MFVPQLRRSLVKRNDGRNSPARAAVAHALSEILEFPNRMSGTSSSSEVVAQTFLFVKAFRWQQYRRSGGGFPSNAAQRPCRTINQLHELTSTTKSKHPPFPEPGKSGAP